MKLKSLRPANDNIHKYVAVIEQDNGRLKTVKFGQFNASDFTKNRDEERKNRYIRRHSGMGEDWNDPLTAGFWSRWLLWNKPTIRESLADLKTRFDL
jgi:hypothetical protein